MRSVILACLILSILLAACTPAVSTPPPMPSAVPSPTAAPAPTPTMTEQELLTQYAPRPSDDRLIRRPVEISGFDLFALETNPPQHRLTINGVLPSTCYVPRLMVHPADTENRVVVEVYGLVEPDAVPNYPKPFKASISLDDVQPSSYTIWVNDELAGELLLP